MRAQLGCGRGRVTRDHVRVTQEPDDVAAAIAGELSLMDPAVRASRTETARLLDPEFTEVGASGRRYTYAETVAELPDHPGSSPTGPRYEPSAIRGVLLAPGLVHLTYTTTFAGHRAHRTSLWRKQSPRTPWRMYYHQATPIPPTP